ncbi:MAG: patatin-like protein [Chlorobiaceae bacterium]|nr:patatin-like protein [Chlorobiaceae bacterium]
MNPPPSKNTADDNKIIYKEIRFAVVMYGGISLAIYMNGIAQELLSLVKSTAINFKNCDNPPDSEKKDTSSVYRAIADYLSSEDETPAFPHKFVVDIISGTSAGGINGICLAKGLVRGLDDLKVLENVWLEEGDINYLLNDSGSKLWEFPSKEPKSSLFNSQRMYAKLLKAFKDMEMGAKKEPYVKSMDLFVTATDLLGLQRPVQLSAGKAYEHIFKHVFPFRYRKEQSPENPEQSDFTGDFDPMLAFAARCTSSIPPAFEPVKVTETIKSLKANWQTAFFQKYNKSDNTLLLEERAFADGGYLDNRPFGHAIDAIHARQADCPIERKLLFIDPSPESNDGREGKQEISVLKNSMLALTLPRYETIREEISGLKKRNDWILKVRHILETKLLTHNQEHLKTHIIDHEFNEFKDNVAFSVDENVTEKLFSVFRIDIPESEWRAFQEATTPEDRVYKRFWTQMAQPQQVKNESEVQRKDFNTMLKAFGGAYPAYHYTRLNLLTDQLALMLARAGMVDEDSEVFDNIRENLKEWRTKHYTSVQEDIPDSAAMDTENMFFREFDIDFRIRRLSYIRKMLEKALSENKVVHLYFGIMNSVLDTAKRDEKWCSVFVSDIHKFYRTVCSSIESYYRLRERLLSFGQQSPLYNALETMALESIQHPLSAAPQGSDQLRATIKNFLWQNRSCSSHSATFNSSIDALMRVLGDFIAGKGNNHSDGTVHASDQLSSAFVLLAKTFPEIAGRLRFIYDYGYDLYDATTYQLLASGDYGEGNVVDIFRISPPDALSLWDETKRKKSKLAGDSLGAFGGFLDRNWRRNDIMWGRLDAAETIITALLPDEIPSSSDAESEKNSDRAIKREEFILGAQKIILKETLETWIEELDPKRFTSQSDDIQYRRLQHILEAFASTGKEQHKSGDPEWKRRFMNVYDFNRELEPESTLKLLGRGTGILSSMIDRLDAGKGVGGKLSSYLKKLNWILLGMLDFSTPKTMIGVLAGYWLQLLMVVSIVTIGLGFVLKEYDTNSVLKYVGSALLIVDIITLMVRRLLETNIHKITANRRIVWLFRIVVGIFALLLFFALLILYDVINVNWGLFFDKFIAACQKSYFQYVDHIKRSFI